METLESIFEDIDSYVDANFPEGKKDASKKEGVFWSLHYSTTSKLLEKANNTFEKNMDIEDREVSIEHLQNAIRRLAKQGHTWLIVRFRKTPTDANPLAYPLKNPLATATRAAVGNTESRNENMMFNMMQQNMQMQLALIEKSNDQRLEAYKKEVEMREEMKELKDTIGALQVKPPAKGWIAKAGELLENNKIVQGIFAAKIANVLGIDLGKILGTGESEKGEEETDTEEEPMTGGEKLEQNVLKVFGEDSEDTLLKLANFIEKNPEMAKNLMTQIDGSSKNKKA